jgi:hypothetical protein
MIGWDKVVDSISSVVMAGMLCSDSVPTGVATTTVLVPKLVLGAGLINHIRVRKYRSTIQTLNPTVKGG